MKTKKFISSTINTNNSKKSPDYWGVLFISFIFLSTISCFLFANHTDRSHLNSASSSAHVISATITDIDQQRKR
jgi:hypothetical protein